MKSLGIFLSLFLLFIITSCSRQKQEVSSLKIINGYILEDKDKGVLYLQDIESTSMVELSFVNDKNKDLNFEDFGHVEVIGQFNQNCNCLIVEQILPLRELLVLDPGISAINK